MYQGKRLQRQTKALTKEAIRRCFAKKRFKNFAKFLKRNLNLFQYEAWRPATFKETPTQMFHKNFHNNFFEEHFRTTSSELYKPC